MAQFSNKKNPFEDLSDDWRDKVATMDSELIRLEMAQVTMNEQDNQSAMEDDDDLQNAKEQAKIAGEGYKEATKANKLKLKFLRQVLEDKGKA